MVVFVIDDCNFTEFNVTRLWLSLKFFLDEIHLVSMSGAMHSQKNLKNEYAQYSTDMWTDDEDPEPVVTSETKPEPTLLFIYNNINDKTDLT